MIKPLAHTKFSDLRPGTLVRNQKGVFALVVIKENGDKKVAFFGEGALSPGQVVTGLEDYVWEVFLEP